MKIFKIFLFILLLLFQDKIYSKDKLFFCLNVTEEGEPEWYFNTITFNNTNKPILCLVQVDKPLEKNKYVIFKLFKQNDSCGFDLQNVFIYDISESWNWFFYKFYIHKAGIYRVRVEDENEQLIAEDELRLLLMY